MESNDKSYEDNALNVDSYEDETLDQNTNSPSSSQLLIVNETDESDEEDDTEKYYDDLLSSSGPVQQIATFGKSDASSSFFMYMLAAYRPEDIERYLLAGFDINEADRFGVTAIMYAKLYNDQKAEETLLNKGAQKTQERIVIDNQFMFLQIYHAATNPMEPVLLEKVCQVLGCSLEGRNEAGETVLLAAVRDSNKNAILNLLEAGALIDDQVKQEAKTNELILETLQRKKKPRLTAAPTFEKLVSGSSVYPACYASSAPFVPCAEPNKELHTNKACPSNAGNDQTECNEQQPKANSVSNIGQATVKSIENTSQESLTERINCEHDNVDISENGCEFVRRHVHEENFPSSDTSIEEDIAQVATEPAELQGSPSFYIYLLAAFKPEDLEQHLSRGGDVNAADSFGVTPLMYAQIYNDSMATKILTELGAKFPKESKEKEKIVIDESFVFRQICGAARSIEEPSLVVLVCQVLGCPVDMRNEAGETALEAAVRDSNINAVQNLLTAGARIDDRILQACKNQSIYEILFRKIEETTTRDVGCENCGSSVKPIYQMFSLPLLSYTVSTACVNEANQDLLSNRTDSNDVDNNQTENAFEDVTCNIQQQDDCSLTQTRDTSEITNIQQVSLESQSGIRNVENQSLESPSKTRTIENISRESPPKTSHVEKISPASPSETRSVENISQKSSSETRHVENVSQESHSETKNVENISQKSSSETRNVENVSQESHSETKNVEKLFQKSSPETRHVENVSQGSQKETGNVQILSQDDAWEINAESESQPGDLYNTNFGDRLEAPAFLKFHNSDGDSTTELSSTSSSQSNIEPETSTLSASSGVDNSYLNHLATESKSKNTNIQTADETCLGSIQTSSQEQMTSDNKVYETPSLQTQNENMGAGPNVMPTPRNESESGFFSMQK